MFGAVPGPYKTSFHAKAIDPKDFAQAIVDVFAATKPQLTIIDAVIAMEGAGPAAGRPHKLGLVLASRDAVALDAICSYIMGYEINAIETTNIAEKRGLGTADFSKIEIRGSSLTRAKNFKLTGRVSRLSRRLPKFMYKWVTKIAGRIRIEPVINQKNCTACRVCLENCPVNTIFENRSKKMQINHKNCIMCFCCQELCKYKAVDTRRSLIARILRIG
jgi:TPP-dependent indolepyruvate ferredoxin oxidoreductase alpha subunit